VARIFSERVLGADLVARYGGEEFLFCFVGSDATAGEQRCEDLRLALEREDWTMLSSGLRVTMSVGLATSNGEFEASALLDRADTCLYQAKRLGRNQVVTGSTLRFGTR